MALQHSNTPTTQLVPILRESLVSVLNPAVGETIAHSRAQQQQRRKRIPCCSYCSALAGMDLIYIPYLPHLNFSITKTFQS
jgi:hypothetical protein